MTRFFLSSQIPLKRMTTDFSKLEIMQSPGELGPVMFPSEGLENFLRSFNILTEERAKAEKGFRKYYLSFYLDIIRKHKDHRKYYCIPYVETHTL